jgi:ribosomal-protein-alanine N-acetyltransferase
MPTPTLETPRLLLQPLALEDAAQVQELFPHWDIVRHLNAIVPWPYPDDGALTFFRDVALPAAERGDEWHWTIRLKSDAKQLVGCINLKRTGDENRGFWLALPWHGRGLMTEAADAVTDFWFEVLKFPVLRVGKAIGNTASRRISEKQGMRLVEVVERDYVSGRAPAEIWESTAHEWRARKIAKARVLLSHHFDTTPLVRSQALARAGCDVYLKNETVLPTASFKVRGAVYALSTNVARHTIGEVVAASTGNHGAAVAFAGRLLGVPVRIFLPDNPNPVKAGRIRDQGAVVVEAGADLNAAIEAASDYSTRTGAFFLHDAADPDIPIGPATIGAEIVDQLPDVATVYVPMGDTALIRGVASALKLHRRPITVVGVAAAEAPAYYLSWRAGTVIETDSANTIADGLAVRRPLATNVAAIRELVDDVVTVSEQELMDAMALLESREGIVAEPAGAAATAALLKQVRGFGGSQVRGFQGSSAQQPNAIVVLVTGGNRRS